MVRRSRGPIEPTALGQGVDGAWLGCGLVTVAGVAGMLTIILANEALDRVRGAQGPQVAGWVAFALVLAVGLPIGASIGGMVLKPWGHGATRALVVVGAALCAGAATGATPVDLLLPRPLAVVAAISATAALAGAGVLRRRERPM